MDKSNVTTFTAACADFFGKQPGQGLAAFGAELKALTAEDRADITVGLAMNGYIFEPVAQAA